MPRRLLTKPTRVVVVIPCYNVGPHIAEVLRGIPPWVQTIVCVDDASTDDTAERIRALKKPQVVLLRHERNQGVGGAMITGYQWCLKHGADVIVKLDGDGQMDPSYLGLFAKWVATHKADYVKGNRWHHTMQLSAMPWIRRVGNIGLSLVTKMATGYWKIFDPCNGYTAIHGATLAQVPLQSIARDYFFETSMLTELNILRAKVVDVPIPAKYGTEKSSLRIRRVLVRFPIGLSAALLRRLWLRHIVREFGPAALFLTSGALLTTWGIGFGIWRWILSIWTTTPTTAGTVMLAGLPVLMGFQLLLQFGVLDINDQPRRALGKKPTVSPKHYPVTIPFKTAA